MLLQKGFVLSRKYEIQEFIGKGLIFEVYRARHTRLSKDVALKVLVPEIASDLEFTRFVIQVIRNMAFLEEHPHISWVHDIDKDGLYIFFVMDFLPRGLDDIIEGISFEDAIAIIMDILDALRYAHSKGLIHKDIRPSNVRFNETDSVVLVDFGMAEIAAKAAMKFKRTAFIPPPNYTAPEQIKSFELADNRSDIYSVGALLYHMLTKKLPFEGDIKQIYYQKLSGIGVKPPRSINPDIPPEIERLILKALSPDPSERFQSAEEMLEELKGFSKQVLGKFVLSEFEERRPEGTFKRKIDVREGIPFKLEGLECPSVIKKNEPFDLKLIFSGEGEGRVEISIPNFISISSPPYQNFTAPREISWNLITTQDVYGAYNIEIAIYYGGKNIFKEPIKVPILIIPVEDEMKGGKTKKTSFRIFGLGR